MTSVITVLDVEAIEHLDWKPPCEVESCPHGKPPNLMLRQGKHRICRTCLRASQRKYARNAYQADPEAGAAKRRAWRASKKAAS